MELELEEECKIFEEKLQQDLVSESAIVDYFRERTKERHQKVLAISKEGKNN